MCILETFLDVKIFEWLQIFLIILNCYLETLCSNFFCIYLRAFLKKYCLFFGQSFYNWEAFRRAFLSTRILTEVRVFLSILQYFAELRMYPQENIYGNNLLFFLQCFCLYKVCNRTTLRRKYCLHKILYESWYIILTKNLAIL